MASYYVVIDRVANTIQRQRATPDTTMFRKIQKSEMYVIEVNDAGDEADTLDQFGDKSGVPVDIVRMKECLGDNYDTLNARHKMAQRYSMRTPDEKLTR